MSPPADSKISANQKFCDKDGADVTDDITLDVYVEMNEENDAVRF